MPTITNEITLDSTNPQLLMTAETEFTAGNVVHQIPGSSDPYVSLSPATLRNGQHIAFYDDEDAALAAIALLRQPGAFTLEYPERAAWEMRFIVHDRVVLRLDQESLEHWTITFGYQELAP